MRKDTKQRLFAALPALALLCVFSSCASSTNDAAKAPDSPSDAALLDESTKPGATDVAEATAFGDLDASKADAAKKDDSAAAAPVAEGDTFYSSVGGETLRRVAFTLYSDKSFSKKLLEKNPDLKGVKKLSTDQKVFFDMDAVRPEPRYLTKDLLNRYAQPLAERLQSEAKEKGLAETTVTLNKGESLQDLSQRLYGTHRYWTEIYLVNRDKIQNYDKVKAGVTLSVVNRPSNGVAKAEAPAAVAATNQSEETPPPPAPPPTKMAKPVPVVAPVEAIVPIQSEPVPTQPEPIAVKEAPKDPIPEIPPVAEKAPPPAALEPPKTIAVAETPKPIPAALEPADAGSSNSSLRRILYVALILAIGGAAFYFTRTPKRPKVDMLDLNAGASGRPKLASKDSQETHTG